MLRDEVVGKLDPSKVALWGFLRSIGPGEPLSGEAVNRSINVRGVDYMIESASGRSLDIGSAGISLHNSAGHALNYDTLDAVMEDYELTASFGNQDAQQTAALLSRMEQTLLFWKAFASELREMPAKFSAAELDGLHSRRYMAAFRQQLIPSGRVIRKGSLDAKQDRQPLEYCWDTYDSITFVRPGSPGDHNAQIVVEGVHALRGIIFNDPQAEDLRRLYVANHIDLMAYLGVKCAVGARQPGSLFRYALAAGGLVVLLGYSSLTFLTQPPSGSSFAAATPTPAVSATPMAATQVAASTPVPVSTPQAVAPLVPGVLGRDYHLGLPVVPYGEQTSRRYSVNAPIVPSGNLPGLPTPAASPAPRAGQGFLPVVPASYTSK